MDVLVQIKGTIPKRLKIRSKAALALMDETFSGWVEAQLEAWVSEVEARLGIPLDVAPASTDAGEDTRHAATVS